ncbi:MAG TPA: carboxylating nicotinate-nucleotide diphosphorylase [Methanobacterium sp.]|nr:carboxylating nicotinate-nucleotide diphosphorylase [Methanobacterium sp.]
MKPIVNDLIRMLNQDIGFEDITTKALIPPGLEIKARIVSNQEGVAAGVDLVSMLLREFLLTVSELKKDGANLKAGDTVLEIAGDADSILTLERTVLNLLMRMSGIATMTSRMVKEARKTNSAVIVAGTRKTTPGLQFWEKEAVRLGGGDTHRFRLDDAVLIKDNHLALVGDVDLAVKKARKYASFTKKIEIEVENLEDTLTAVGAGADIVMLDNMGLEDIKLVIEALEAERIRDKVLIEVSGGIDLENIAEYADTGVDIISSGYITHSAGVVDMSLEIVE